ncbi:2Fe-2S iron-sulfur cluster-binding protein [Streptomyces sp. NPDC002520]
MTDDQHAEGAPQGGGRWDPLPQGDYDDGATAFVKLPEGGIDALLAGDSPLAAPGHGYVPPPITATDPAAAGAWGVPADGRQWPDANAVPQQQAADDRFTYNPGATQQWTYEEPAAPPAPGHDVTGQWSIPVAGGDLPDESGEFTTSSLVEQWGGTPPATLPGGAPAPWASEAAGRPWGQQEPAPQQGAPAEASLTGHAPAPAGPGPHAPEGFTPERAEGTYAEGPADHVTAPPPHGTSVHPGYEADDTGGVTPAGHGPGEAPEGPVGGPAAHAATAETRHAPKAAQTPVTAAAPATSDPAGTTGPTGPVDADGAAVPSGQAGVSGTADASAPVDASGTSAATGPAAPADTHGPADTSAHETPDAPDGTAADRAAHEPPAAEALAADGPATDTASLDGAAPADASAEADAAPLQPNDDHPLASYVLRVNGGDRPVTDAWIGESLLYVLRERLGLAGAKDGCSQGECGACNVQVDGRLVASCLVPAVTASGSEVRTVEGLAADGQPSDVQRALARCGAVQCGFCVPGMAMTLHDLLEGNPAPTELETRQALCGNLCRCSGYRGVVDAVKEVVAEREAHTAAPDDGTDADGARIPRQAGPGAGGVNPSAFEAPGVFGGSGAFGTQEPHDRPPGPHDQHPGPLDQHYGQDGGQA